MLPFVTHFATSQTAILSTNILVVISRGVAGEGGAHPMWKSPRGDKTGREWVFEMKKKKISHTQKILNY